jgi:hypothetical protein
MSHDGDDGGRLAREKYTAGASGGCGKDVKK